MDVNITDLKDLQQFTKRFVKNIRGGEVIALKGELGAGKTAFSKAFLHSAGIKKRINSPTFVLMIPYKKSLKTFYHMDLYRISGYKDIQALGIEDLWNKKNNIFLIEWAEKVKKHLPKNTIFIDFKIKQDNRRQLRIKNVPKNFKI
jgi:tRNA threonylcarbamoyladenosine biosynthesis protein TsaE